MRLLRLSSNHCLTRHGSSSTNRHCCKRRQNTTVGRSLMPAAPSQCHEIKWNGSYVDRGDCCGCSGNCRSYDHSNRDDHCDLGDHDGTVATAVPATAASPSDDNGTLTTITVITAATVVRSSSSSAVAAGPLTPNGGWRDCQPPLSRRSAAGSRHLRWPTGNPRLARRTARQRRPQLASMLAARCRRGSMRRSTSLTRARATAAKQPVH